MKQYTQIFSFLKPYTLAVGGSIVLAILYSLANIYCIPLVRDIFSEIMHKNLSHFNNQIFNAGLLYAVLLGTKYGGAYLRTYVSFCVTVDIKMLLFKKLEMMDQTFYAKWKLGDMLSRLISDVEKMRETVTVAVWDMIPQVLTFVGVAGYLFYLNWKLTLFTLIAVPVFVMMISSIAGKLKRVSHQRQRFGADATHVAQEALSNMKLVQAYTMEKREYQRFYRENNRNFKAVIKGVKMRSTLEPMVGYMQFLVILCVIWYGGFEIAKGTLDGPSLASFFTGIFLLIDPVLSISNSVTGIQQGWASVERVYELLDYPIGIQNAPDKVVPDVIKGRVRFQNVFFSYDGKTDVLKHIQLEAKEGEIVALVGLSGAGKSTLINLLPRFYDVTSGVLEIDGIPIQKWDIETLRRHIGVVPQEDILFRGTVLDNIRYGWLEATEEDVIEAAKKAHAWEFIKKMPRKMRTMIGDRGRRLSGGQKQRISIARAILRDPKILILDEATSSLDSVSESLVQDALNHLMENRTTFVIAHRLSTIQHAHKIVVLQEGEIKEMGTHEALLEEGGIYTSLYHKQFMGRKG